MTTMRAGWLDGLPDLRVHRGALFGPAGFCVLRGFCSSEETRALRRFWHRFPMPGGTKGYWIGRPNYALHGAPPLPDGGRTSGWPVVRRLLGRPVPSRPPAEAGRSRNQGYECFFWNPPEDALTYEIAWAAHVLRNVVCGLPPSYLLLPFDGYACTYRPTRTDAGGRGVSSHTDKFHPRMRYSIQASLTLSTMGRDFDGGGLFFSSRDGRRMNLNESEALEAGDLLLFDQVLEHSAEPVTRSDPEDPLSGSWRMILPMHPVVPSPTAWRSGMTLHEGRLPAHILEAPPEDP